MKNYVLFAQVIWIVLKLKGVVDLAWWKVLSPLWLSALILVGAYVYDFFKEKKDNKDVEEFYKRINAKINEER